jgi:hypothetical protein
MQATKRQKPAVTKREKRRSISEVVSEESVQVPTTKLAVLKQGIISKKLGGKLIHWIQNEIPGNTFAAEPVTDGSAYSSFIWQDDEGSKLLLENLPRKGNIVSLEKDTAQAIKVQTENAGLKEIPATIMIHTPDSSESKMRAKKLILDYIRTLPKPTTPIERVSYVLQETESLPLDNNEVAIKFSVETVRATPVFTKNEFITQMGEDPGKDVKIPTVVPIFGGKTLKPVSTLYKNILTALDLFHEKLALIDEPVQGDATEVKNSKRDELDSSVQELETATGNYIDESTTTPTGMEQKKEKKDAARELLTRVQASARNGFADELDNIRRKRWEGLKPLTDDQIIPGTKKSVGSGAQGEVFRFSFQKANPPAPVFVAVVKYDDDTYLNENAVNAGIPGNYPQQSLRAIAAYKLSSSNLLDVIPETEQFMHTDNAGHAKLGQALEFVIGSVGQRKVALRNAALRPEEKHELDKLDEMFRKGSADEKRKASDKLLEYNVYHDVRTQDWFPKEPISDSTKARLNGLDMKRRGKPLSIQEQQELDKFVTDGVSWFHAVERPININYHLEAVQKGLSDLQIFDCIIGHADRNPGNWIYVKDSQGVIIGVRGIDNDDSFGQKWKAKVSGDSESSKTPDVPPVVDIITANIILQMNLESSSALEGLSAEEIAATKTRLEHVKDQIRDRARKGFIADFTSRSSAVRSGYLAKLRVLVNGQGGAELPPVRNWGKEVTDLHAENNSYLGSQIAQAGVNNVDTVPDDNIFVQV